MLKQVPIEKIKTIEELLTPISSEEPCGPYLKRDPAISRLKDLRKLDSGTDGGVWKVKAKEEDEDGEEKLNESITLSEEFLTKQSKDLWVAVYYTEALFKEYGYMGLAHGLNLIEGLCDRYWEQVHPGMDEVQGPIRLTTLRLLSSVLEEKLNTVPIVESGDKSYTVFDITKTKSPTKVKNNIIVELTKENKDELNAFKSALEDSIKDVDSIDQRGADLDITLESTDAPSFRAQLEKLEMVLGLVKSALDPKEAKMAAGDADTEEGEQSPGTSNTTGTSVTTPGLNLSGNPIKSIQDAYKMIEKINEYLLEHDSHSPCPYLIRRAADWRKKGVYELYADIFASISRPEELFSLLAIQPKPDPAAVLPPQSAAPAGGGALPPASPAPSASPYGAPAANPYGSPAGGSNPYGGAGGANPYGGGSGGGYNPYGSGGGY